MPIKGFVRECAVEATRYGQFWLGDPASGKGSSKMPGRDLQTCFRVELPSPFSGMFSSRYKSLKPEQINIFFPFDAVEDCFQYWLDCNTEQGFQHRCDGEHIIRKVEKIATYTGGKARKRRSAIDCQEPCQKKPGEFKCAACEETGYLSIQIRELVPYAGNTKIVVGTLSGVHNIIGIIQQLQTYQQKYGSLRVSPVPSPYTQNLIPFVLRRHEIEISRPLYDAQSKTFKDGFTKGKAYPILISEDPEWLAHWTEVTRRSQIMQMVGEGKEHLLMSADLKTLQEMRQVAFQLGSTTEETHSNILPPAIEPIDLAQSVEQIEDSKLLRPNKDRVAAFELELGQPLDPETKRELWSMSDGESQSEKCTDFLNRYLVLWASKVHHVKTETIIAYLGKIAESFPDLVDEDLAALVRSEIDNLVDVPVRTHPTTVKGQSID